LCCHATKLSRARFMSEVSRNVAIAGFHVATLVARILGAKQGGKLWWLDWSEWISLKCFSSLTFYQKNKQTSRKYWWSHATFPFHCGYSNTLCWKGVWNPVKTRTSITHRWGFQPFGRKTLRHWCSKGPWKKSRKVQDDFSSVGPSRTDFVRKKSSSERRNMGGECECRFFVSDVCDPRKTVDSVVGNRW